MRLVKDPLLTAANVVLVFLIAVCAVGAAALTIGAPVAWVMRERIVAAFIADGASEAARIFPALSLLMLAVAALLGLAIYFLVLLRRVVRSVGDGDPFVPVNAARLSRMGWAVVAGELLSMPIGRAVVWIATIVADDKRDVRVGDDFGLSITGVLLALVLFILARVFRRGAEMREELEGTV